MFSLSACVPKTIVLIVKDGRLILIK